MANKLYPEMPYYSNLNTIDSKQVYDDLMNKGTLK